MAQITKTVIYPLPTEWYGDEQDITKSGICTYVGPDKITMWWSNYGTDENPRWILDHSFPSDTPEDRDPPIGSRVIELDVNTHPLNAIALWGGIEGPNWIETPAGPDDEPNPILADYHHFNEVFDLRSFNYNFDTESWDTGRFSGVHTEEDEWSDEGEQQKTFGWDWVRVTRNNLLRRSDTKIPADAPESFASAWREYRQKLRDLPEKWASVGEKTYLIVWPQEPDTLDMWNGVASNSSQVTVDVSTEGPVDTNKVYRLDGTIENFG